jgi:hypothetical protein
MRLSEKAASFLFSASFDQFRVFRGNFIYRGFLFEEVLDPESAVALERARVRYSSRSFSSESKSVAGGVGGVGFFQIERCPR